MTTDILLNILLLSFLMVTALAIARMRNLFPVAMLTGLFSLLSASVFTLLDAVDVALTEAAVGAGAVTVLYLATLGLTRGREKPVRPERTVIGLVVVAITGAALFYASLDMPHFGDADTPVQTHPVRDRYLEQMPEEIDIPNAVTAVLASYRGYDTLGEVVVVLAAGIGALMLLGARRRRRREDDDSDA